MNRDPVQMWVADTDFAGPKPLVEALVARAQQGMYGYGKFDVSATQAAVVHWLSTRFGWTPDPASVLYVTSVVPAIICAIQAFTDPGDKVMIQSPIYPPFHGLVGSCGREKVVTTMVPNPDKGGPDWVMDFEDIEEKCRDRMLKVFLLCNPHNPLGRVFTREELTRLVEICHKHNVLILSDEIHFDLVFPSSPYKHICLPTLGKDVADNCAVFINPSKTFNVPGLRCAAAIIPNRNLRKKYQDYVASQRALGSTLFGTIAIETVYNECGYYVDQLMDYLQRNLDYTLDYFERRIPSIKVTKPEATYLLWLDCRGLGFASSGELEAFFVKEVKVGMNDGATFGEEGVGFMRMNIACRMETLKDALARIERGVNKLLESQGRSKM